MPHINNAGLNLIESFEGENLKAYPDPGTGSEPYTIGYGHTANVYPGETITQAQALAFLKQDVSNAEQIVSHEVEVILTPNQFSALVSFEYNTGAIAAGAPILQCLNSKDFTGAMVHLNKYIYGGGGIMEGLVRRRAAETVLFNTP
jgi:lysozyme